MLVVVVTATCVAGVTRLDTHPIALVGNVYLHAVEKITVAAPMKTFDRLDRHLIPGSSRNMDVSRDVGKRELSIGADIERPRDPLFPVLRDAHACRQ